MDSRHLLQVVRECAFGLWLSVILAACSNIFFEETENDNLAVYDAFYEEIDRHFSFFELLTANFDSAYLTRRTLLEANPTHESLAEAIQVLIDILEDGHTNAYIPERIAYTGWFDSVPYNQLEDITDKFASYKIASRAVEYGTVDNRNIGYIRISSFGNFRNEYEVIDQILNELSTADGIILDVRSNGGGDSDNADIIISRFNDERRLSFRESRRTGQRDEFSGWVSTFTPIHNGFRYIKPVTVLTNRQCFSTTEWFVAGMRTMPHVTIVGDTTGGGSGNPLMKELPNGFEMRTSNTRKELPEGGDYQIVGLFPDIPLWISAEDSINDVDTIFDKALEILP